jgi:hypothetical protein
MEKGKAKPTPNETYSEQDHTSEPSETRARMETTSQQRGRKVGCLCLSQLCIADTTLMCLGGRGLALPRSQALGFDDADVEGGVVLLVHVLG